MKLTSCAVALTRCPTYEIVHVKEQVARLCQASGFALSRGDKVLLKPNLVAAGGRDGLALTHPNLVRAMVEWCLDHGAAVKVGDSPAFGSAASVMAACGLTDVLAGLPVQYAAFQQGRQVVTESGIRVVCAEDIFTCDSLVNLPKLKAHGQMRVTMAVKNYFGVVLTWRKALAHMSLGGSSGKFERMLVDLIGLVPEGISLIDGVTAMHRTGPMDGDPIAAGVLGASRNPVALDTAMLEVIGLSPSLSPLARECHRRNLPGSMPKDVCYPLLSSEEVTFPGFITPEVLDPVRFQVGRFVRSSIRRVFQQAGENRFFR